MPFSFYVDIFFFIINKLFYYFTYIFQIVYEAVANILIYNFLKYFKKYFKKFKRITPVILKKLFKIFKTFQKFIQVIFEKFKQLNLKQVKIKKIKRKITPNLTLYYPLPTSILSVSIRFMGAILLILIFFCASFFLLVTVYQIDFQILSLFLTIILYITISSFGYHILNSLSHFLRN